MNFLYQLVYTSKRNPNCTDAEIQKILEACKKNNVSKDITGVLLHSDDHFIQYLEGDKDIIKLYDLIKDDKRHKHVVLLSYGPLKQRIFPAWHMGYKSITKDQLEFLTNGNEKEKALYTSLLRGEKQEGIQATNLLVKFFNKC